MLRILLVAVVVLLAAGAYIASPFRAAWVLREAIKTSDTATLQRKVEWEGVRRSLRASIAANANLLPEVTAAGEAIKPTLWQRVKTAFGASMLDRFIEAYVTPEGLPKLFQHRQTLRSLGSRTAGRAGKAEHAEANAEAPGEDALTFADRVKRFYARVKRAEFKSPTLVEIEMADPATPGRHIITVMELHGTEWKLAALRITGGGGGTRRDLVGLP